MDENISEEESSRTTVMRGATVRSSGKVAVEHPLMFTSSPISPPSDYPDLIPIDSVKKKDHHRHHGYEKQQQQHGVSSSSAGGSYHLEYSTEDLDDSFKLDEDDQQVVPGASSPPTLLKYEIEIKSSDEQMSDDDDDGAEVEEEEENDKSVYEAHLSTNLKHVALTMNEKEGNLNFLSHNRQSHKLRKIKLVPSTTHEEDLDSSDISSLDSSPSDSLKSEDVWQGRGDDGVESSPSHPPIEPLSAEAERRHARHWQRVLLPGGEERTIDMRVIEPYKRCLSHGGYLHTQCHTAIIIFAACYLPAKSRCDYAYVMDNLFLYVLWTLERLVTDDYVLVYLHGGGTGGLPSFSWLKRCYQLVGRKLRKNLARLYVVHPTLWIRTMLFMAKPFISTKFYRKISFVGGLKELRELVPPLELAAIPDKVTAYDSSLHCRSHSS